MKLLMISGDRSILRGRKGAFFQTLTGFAREWERIDVVCPRADGQLQIAELPNVFFHPCPHGLWYQPRWILKKGKALIREHEHDVMTVHDYPPFYNGIGAMKLHYATGIPYCIEIHHVVGHPLASSVREWIGRWISRLFLRFDTKNAAAVRTVSQSVAETLKNFGIPREKISVVPSFYLDRALLTADPSIEKRFDLCFCGRLVENKGLLELLDVVDSLPGVTLLVIGDGPLLSRARARVESSSLRDRVTFRGWVAEQSDVLKNMQSAQIFVMNSRSEGGPRVALEAMALGLPVISTRVGVMTDVLRSGENGILVDGTQAELSSAIQSLLRDAALRQKIGASAQAITDRFERSLLLSQYAAFLRGLAR